MVFRSFRVRVIVRVLVLATAITLLAWCLVHALYLRSAYVALGVLLLTIEFIVYVDRFNRDMRSFLISLRQHDFTTHFKPEGRGQSFHELYEAMNGITAIFKTISAEKEIQYRYLEMLVEHVRVSILSFDADGKIHLANQAVKDLLQKTTLLSLRSLESFDPSFVNTLREIRSGETRLVRLRTNRDALQLSIHASEFKLEGKYYKLISMQNIRSELDAREMEAWQKLIRVLSHEIMNSVAPIISLSGTLHGMVTQNTGGTLREAQHNALDSGLNAIRIRSEGLFNFTQSYRKLTGVPKVALRQVPVQDLVRRVQVLLQPKLDEQRIPLTVSGIEADVMIDPDLMEQVLINLLLNAIEAVAGKPDARIDVRTSRHARGNVCIHVIDNGEGMDDATSEKIFIPFFTTRKNGSGIGLAISKQILQLHHADIQLETRKGVGSEFTILL